MLRPLIDFKAVGRRPGALVGILLIGLTACRREEITTYSVPKEKPTASVVAEATPMSPPAKATWTVPNGWEELTASGMRAGAFKVVSTNGSAEISVTPFPGVSGIELDSVNMWRQTLGLKPFAAEEFAKAAEPVAVGPIEGKLVDMAADSGSTNKNRTVGAIVSHGGTLWFFKMAGDDGVVASQRSNFRQFLKSVVFTTVDEQKIVARDGGGAMSTNAKRGPHEETPSHNWKTPEGWVEQAPSSMVLASYAAAGKSGKADVSVTMFPGDVGGVLANVNRWRKQLGLAPISEADLTTTTKQTDVGGAKAVMVELKGKSVRSGADAEMLALIVPREGNTWFYKMMGDGAAIAEQRKTFLEFAGAAH